MYVERKIRLSEAEKQELKDFEFVLRKYKNEIKRLANEALAELKARPPIQDNDAEDKEACEAMEDPYEPYP